MPHHERVEQFRALSATLCGVDAVDLDGTGMCPVYLQVLDEHAGASVTGALLDTFSRDVPGGPEAAREAAVRRYILSDPCHGPLARNLIKLWYFGTWYRLPVNWYLCYGEAASVQSYVVSASAYASALVWPAMGAHPKGARQPGFGSWQFPPIEWRRD